MTTKPSFDVEIETFIKDFVNDLVENNVAIFAGAGMSKEAGFVDWRELLYDIAKELRLSVDKEHDLLSLAQFHVNENRSRSGIIKKILLEFSQQAEPTETHRLLARLPITTYWTTNYDTLIEDTLKSENKVVDVKHQVNQLTTTRPKRDVVVYKMHGDIQAPSDAIITKEQYEKYHRTHEHFITALSGDLVSKTFLFIGFSFNDPNLDYVLSRLNIQFGEYLRTHYCFIKREKSSPGDDPELTKYNQRKQELRVSDLKRFKIHALLINEYSDIIDILREISWRYRKKTIFISGSAEEYGLLDRNDAQNFIHLLSKRLIQKGYNIVNGFGWGVGSAVINGALEAIFENPNKYSEDQLIIKPFPQFDTGSRKLPELWEDYRQKMISLAGIAIFVFGNIKDSKGEIVNADGVLREFKITISQGLIPIPIGPTGYVAKEIYDEVTNPINNYYSGNEWIIDHLKAMTYGSPNQEVILSEISFIIQTINK
jgi:hypothetical protein